VAEHAIALLFGVRRKLHTADRHVRSGNWERSGFRGHELSGDTLGLLGFGDIAQKTESLARGIGMTVLAYDPYVPAEDLPEGIEKIETTERLFEQSNVVSIHAPLTEETHHSVSTAELNALGADNVLINTARGPIVDEEALIEALESGTIAGAGLDNFETEPPGEDHPLYGLNNVLLTPHVGGVTDQALRRMSQQAAENVRTVYEGRIPDSTVNRDDISR
jgi:D-3-phosphoglycerate dehydrogenase